MAERLWLMFRCLGPRGIKDLKYSRWCHLVKTWPAQEANSASGDKASLEIIHFLFLSEGMPTQNKGVFFLAFLPTYTWPWDYTLNTECNQQYCMQLFFYFYLFVKHLLGLTRWLGCLSRKLGNPSLIPGAQFEPGNTGKGRMREPCM